MCIYIIYMFRDFIFFVMDVWIVGVMVELGFRVVCWLMFFDNFVVFVGG